MTYTAYVAPTNRWTDNLKAGDIVAEGPYRRRIVERLSLRYFAAVDVETGRKVTLKVGEFKAVAS